MSKKADSNLFTVFLDALKVKYTRKFARKLYAEHPHKYNMYGLSKMLSDYRIPNEGFMMEDPAGVTEIEPPFVVQFAGDLHVVEKITDTDVHLFKSGQEVKIPMDKFKEGCTGAVLVAEADENSIEPGYKENVRGEMFGTVVKYGLFVAVVAAVIFVCVRSGMYTDLRRLALLVLNLVGVYVCWLLLFKQLHFNSQAADKICSMFNKKSDCNSVLESKAAKFMGVIGWSELGLGYFVSSAFLVLFVPDLIIYFALLSVGALGYAVWSVWYQRFIAREWCTMCLIIQTLFVLLFVTNIVSGFIEWPVWSAADIVAMAVIYAIPTLGIVSLLPAISKGMTIENLTYNLNHLKMNEDVFGALLVSQPKYDVDRSVSLITFGNPEAEMFVTIVSNPHCNPCSKIHPKIDRLLERAAGGVFVQFFFLNFDSEQTRDSGKFLISARLESGKEEAVKIFTRWFEDEKKSPVETFVKYGFDMESDEVVAEQERHRVWCDTNKISATPTVLVNGHRLPDNYAVDELIFRF